MTARQVGTPFTANVKLALQFVGRWCMNLKALLYATFNLCMLDSSRARDVPPKAPMAPMAPIHWYLVGVSGHFLQAKSVLQNFPADGRQLAKLPRPVVAAKNTRIVRI